jgi:hypothetical protein
LLAPEWRPAPGDAGHNLARHSGTVLGASTSEGFGGSGTIPVVPSCVSFDAWISFLAFQRRKPPPILASKRRFPASPSPAQASAIARVPSGSRWTSLQEGRPRRLHIKAGSTKSSSIATGSRSTSPTRRCRYSRCAVTTGLAAPSMFAHGRIWLKKTFD